MAIAVTVCSNVDFVARFRSQIHEEVGTTEYWTAMEDCTTSRVEVRPAHDPSEAVLLNSSSQVVLMNGDEPLTLEEQAEMMRANKDQFKCLYLLVETAIAMRARKQPREYELMAD